MAGTLVYYQSTPTFNFRAFTPAQMHGAAPGGPMWFMLHRRRTTARANTIRVTEMTNMLSNSPTYTDFSVPVNTYGYTDGGRPARLAGLGGHQRRDDHIGRLPQRQAGDGPSATDASDGFTQTHVHWYEVDVTGGSPALVQEGVVDPGPGWRRTSVRPRSTRRATSASPTWSRPRTSTSRPTSPATSRAPLWVDDPGRRLCSWRRQHAVQLPRG